MRHGMAGKIIYRLGLLRYVNLAARFLIGRVLVVEKHWGTGHIVRSYWDRAENHPLLETD